MNASLALLLAAATATAGPVDAWRDYDARLAAACPARHVGWICGSCQAELIDAYDATLSAPLAQNVAAVADIRRACAAETMGHACEVARSLVAYRRLGLLDRFVAYGCATVKCEEAALCSRFPHLR